MDDVFEPIRRPVDRQFLNDVLAGLSASQKTLPCQYLYDEAGSRLFEQITELPEYYPTRTEIDILNTYADEIAKALGPDVLLVEYGAGASTKTRILLEALADPAGYVPIDVSEEFLLQTADDLRAEYPELPVVPVIGNFMATSNLPAGASGKPVGFFPGSTLGNLSDDEIGLFMRNARALLGSNGTFVLGIDLRKPASILIPAYDDAAGVTAAFNLNLLTRINRELGADFDRRAFKHRAVWNEKESRIEMHLVSQKAQTVHINGHAVAFETGETIHTENSRKFDLAKLVKQFEQAGWRLKTVWQDDRNYFAVILLEAIQ
ncbi:MAG: L-histidine N(alpha)-methyltransferase [Pseudomonadota bacterium]